MKPISLFPNKILTKINLRITIIPFLVFFVFGCTEKTEDSSQYQYILSSDSSFSPDISKFFFIAIYGSRVTKYNNPYIFDIGKKELSELEIGQKYISSKPNWSSDNCSLITSIFSNNMKIEPQNPDDEREIPEELLKYLRKYEKFKELEQKYKQYQEVKLPVIYIADLQKKEFKALTTGKTEEIRGLNPKFTDNSNEILFLDLKMKKSEKLESEKQESENEPVNYDKSDDVKQSDNEEKTSKDEDSNKILSLIKYNIKNHQREILIDDFKYEDFYQIPKEKKLILCNNPDNPEMLEIFDYMRNQRNTIAINKKDIYRVCDIIFLSGSKIALLNTENKNSLEQLYILHLDNLEFELFTIPYNGWINKARIVNDDLLEYIISYKNERKIVSFTISKNVHVAEDVNSFTGDIIDFDNDYIFFIDLKNNLSILDRKTKIFETIYPTDGYAKNK
jgi:hypothetical protein